MKLKTLTTAIILARLYHFKREHLPLLLDRSGQSILLILSGNLVITLEQVSVLDPRCIWEGCFNCWWRQSFSDMGDDYSSPSAALNLPSNRPLLIWFDL